MKRFESQKLSEPNHHNENLQKVEENLQEIVSYTVLKVVKNKVIKPKISTKSAVKHVSPEQKIDSKAPKPQLKKDLSVKANPKKSLETKKNSEKDSKRVKKMEEESAVDLSRII